jgi:hypothetical protein
LFHKLVRKAKDLNIIDAEHISIDSTKLDSYKAAKPKKYIVDDGTSPNRGIKQDTNGNNIRSKGIKKAKVHVLLNCIALLAGTISLNINKSLSKTA